MCDNPKFSFRLGRLWCFFVLAVCGQSGLTPRVMVSSTAIRPALPWRCVWTSHLPVMFHEGTFLDGWRKQHREMTHQRGADLLSQVFFPWSENNTFSPRDRRWGDVKLRGLLVGSPPCLMTTGLSLARAKAAKRARFQWVPLRAGPAGLSKHTKNSKKMLVGPCFQAISGRSF